MTSTLYQKQYENNKKELERIEKKLKELEKLSPEEQNKLYFKQAISEEIWRKKYKAKSDKSIVDTWKRVAKFLSQNEKKKDIWYLYFFDLLEGFKFLPGGRITYGADPDKEKVTLFNCWLPGIKVLTKNGYKNIEDITTEDYVLTHKNKWKKVINSFSREYTGNIYKIKLWNSYQDFYVTEEHPLMTNKGWVRADELQPDMYIKAGGFIEANDDIIDVVDYLKQSSIADKLRYDDEYVWTITEYNAGGRYGKKDTIAEKHSKKIKRYLKYDRDTGWVLGLLLSDGGISIFGSDNGGFIYVTLNEKAMDIANKFSNLSEKIFGVKSKPKIVEVQRNGKRNSWIRVELYSYLLAKFLEKLFNGRYSYNKTLPINWEGQNKEFLAGLIQGLFDGDGFITKDGHVIQLSNEILILQIHRILLRFGIYNSVTNPKPRGKAIGRTKREAYKIIAYKNQLETKLYTDELTYQAHEPMTKAKVIDGQFYYKIKSIEKIPVENEQVYNIAVEDDESYIAWNIVSHNCFIGGKIEDSMEGIMHELTNTVMTLKSGGGYGNNFSTLRPKGSLIKSTGGTSSGVLSFMHIWDEAAKQIRMGNSRRSAMMGILNVDHPEIFDFINAKDRVGFDVPLGFFNMSIGVVDGFMEAVINDIDWDLKFDDKVYKTVKAREILKSAVEHSLINGEPGILFLDNMNWRNNLSYLDEEKIISTNPCAEIIGSYFTSCLLGSFNLTQFVDNPFDSNSSFNFDLLSFYIPVAVRFLDNVIEVSEFPLKEYEEKEKKNRLLGLGVTGLGDTLIMLRKRYGENDGNETAEKLIKFITNNAYNSSIELGVEKGVFPNLDKEKYIQGNFIQILDNKIKEKIKKYGIRNASLMAIAPVGTGSIFANNVSSGIEPIFANEYKRRIRKDDGSPEEQIVMDYAYKLWKDKFGDKPLPEYWKTTNNITFDQHIDILATVQKYIDKSTSKTCVLSHKPSIEEMMNIYIKAWKNKLNGLTIFYPTDKTELVLETTNSKNNKSQKDNKRDKNMKQKSNTSQRKRRPFMLAGRTYKLKTPKEKYSYYVTINDFIDDEGNRRPFEIFINTKDPRQPIFGFISRLLSALFRREKDIEFIIKEMQNTVVNNEGFFDPADGKFVHSLIAYIGKIIKKHIDNYDSSSSSSFSTSNSDSSSNSSNLLFFEIGGGKGKEEDKQEEKDEQKEGNEMSPYGVPWSTVEICPECGVQALVNSNGCKTCMNCGYSKCD